MTMMFREVSYGGDSRGGDSSGGHGGGDGDGDGRCKLVTCGHDHVLGADELLPHRVMLLLVVTCFYLLLLSAHPKGTVSDCLF